VRKDPRLTSAFAETDVIFQQCLLNVVSADKLIKQAEDHMQVVLKSAYLHGLSKLTDRSNYIRQYLGSYFQAANLENMVNLIRGRVEGSKFVLRGTYEPWYEDYTDPDYMRCIGEMLQGPTRPLTPADIRTVSENLILGFDAKKDQWRMLSPLNEMVASLPENDIYVEFEVEVTGDSMFVNRNYQSPLLPS